MKKMLLLIPFVTLLAGCGTFQTTSQPLVVLGGDGSSCDRAVVINNAKHRETARVAEKMWLDQKYPGCRETNASALNAEGKHYDLVEVTTTGGQVMKVYFDSTDSFSK
jgi:hypothetical protein